MREGKGERGGRRRRKMGEKGASYVPLSEHDCVNLHANLKVMWYGMQSEILD